MMGLWVKIDGDLVGVTRERAPKSARPLLSLAAYLLATVFVVAGSLNALGQSPTPTPAKDGDDAVTSPSSTDKTQDQSSGASGSQKNDKGKLGGEKRGSFIIAPIPISSPAFGSGLLVIAAYVFQFDKEDTVSPPSWVGAAGAFTNNGTRGLALGSKLYLKENKYQTTFAFIKGRVNLDFFGVGRIPGRPAVEVPLSMGGTIFFGEFMRNVGKKIFVGPRYQFRHLTASIDGPPLPGGFELPVIDISSNSAALGFHVQRDK